MTTNQMMILAIIVLSSIIVITLIYFTITLSINKKKHKKEEKLFSEKALEEAQPLIESMEKRTVVSPIKKSEKFISNNTSESPVELAKENIQIPSFDPFAFKPENKMEEEIGSNKTENKFFQ